MRTVFGNSELAHVWASQQQPDGRSNSMRFEGDTLYSYAEPIARITSNAAGERCVLVTNRTWSITTTGHTNDAFSATRHIPNRFRVSSPRDIERSRKDAAETAERMILEIPLGRTQANMAKRYEAACRVIASTNLICEFFDLEPLPAPPAMAELDAYLASVKAQRDAEEKARRERFLKDNAAKIRKAKTLARRWIKGESVNVPYVLGTHFIRINGDNVETTLGAVVPVSHVRRMAPTILEKVRAGADWVPDRDIRFGHYRLDRITDAGTVLVGCHRFDRKEIERFAALIMEPETANA